MPATSAPSAHLLHLLPEAVVQTDALWAITYLNPAWHTLTGHPLEAALGRSLLVRGRSVRLSPSPGVLRCHPASAPPVRRRCC